MKKTEGMGNLRSSGGRFYVTNFKCGRKDCHNNEDTIEKDSREEDESIL